MANATLRGRGFGSPQRVVITSHKKRPDRQPTEACFWHFAPRLRQNFPNILTRSWREREELSDALKQMKVSILTEKSLRKMIIYMVFY